MPHAIAMPSLLADESEIKPASNRPSFDLHSYEKTNGNTRSPPLQSIKNKHTDSIDVKVDELTDRGSLDGVTNGGPHQLSNVSAVLNGRYGSNYDSKSLNERTPQRNSRDSIGADNGSKNQNIMAQTSELDNNPNQSTNENPKVVDTDKEQVTNGKNQPTKNLAGSPSIASSPKKKDTSSYLSNFLPASSSTPANNYRFSFPTSNNRINLPIVSSSSSNNFQNQSNSQLINRFTLQVPKSGSARTSGDDAAFTSGRFSPTTLNLGGRRSSFSLTAKNTQNLTSITPQEELAPDEDAMQWAEAVRQKRASKRRKKDDDDDERVIVGTKVDQNHENWVTAYNMLTGIRFTVSRTNAKIDRPLTNADFEARHKFSFDITGNELTPSAKYDFKFKDYAPWIFRHLRAIFKLDPADYLMSLTSKYILSELGSPGKSGSFFYFSRDYKYIIKTIHHSEHKFLRKILRDYYAHVEENPNTLLSQFYGLHRVKMPYGRKIHFVVMNNLFPPHRDIHQTFDLKGSTIGRDYKEEDLEKNPRATLKDLNWLRRNLHLEFGPEKKGLFFDQIEKDVSLLQRLGIMDYSLLVGIHNLQIGNQENLRDKTLQVFQPGGDNPSDEIERASDVRSSLMRTPSKLESARKARELRQIIKQEKPIPMGQSSSRMPDVLDLNPAKRELLFYGDDGGFQATHEDNSPGDQIFFLSIIDCLTHYGTLKKLEHFWKGLKHDKRQISPISPEPYGERFVEFIEGITKSPEEARKDSLPAPVTPIPATSKDVSASLAQDHESTQQKNQIRSINSNAPHEKDVVSDKYRNENKGDTSEARILTATRSTSVERSGSSHCQILPVVEEIGETNNTDGSRSENQSRRSTGLPSENKSLTNINQTNDANGRVSVSSVGSRDKNLPPLPK